MMTDRGSSSDRDRRDEERVTLCEPVHLRDPNKQDLTQGFAMNLSSTGIFVATRDLDKLGAVGEHVRCELSLTPQNPVDLACRVVWIRHAGDSGGPPGVGLTFEDLTSSHSAHLDTLLNKFRHDTTSTLLTIDPFAESGTWAPPGLIEGEKIPLASEVAAQQRTLRVALLLSLLVIAGLITLVVFLLLNSP